MKAEDVSFKELKEANYLCTEKSAEYRSIMRIFYKNYAKLKYNLYCEDIYEEMITNDIFNDYTIEECQRDLNTLTEWKNLSAMQETKKARTIEEFKKKKFRYQMTKASVELERLVTKLETVYIENTSLEPSLLEKIRLGIKKVPEMLNKSDREVYAWWGDLDNDFKHLNKNYQDYLRELNSPEAENLMNTESFIVYKGSIIEYLRSFVKSLQENVSVIEEQLKSYDDKDIEIIIDKVTNHSSTIPRVEKEFDHVYSKEIYLGRWKSLEDWFVSGNDESEAIRVFNETTNVIRRITTYALRIAEMSNMGANRRQEYKKIVSMFNKCVDVNEAHRLSAYIFGVEKPLNLRIIQNRKTDSTNVSVYEEDPCMVLLKSRSRTYKETAKRSPIMDRSAEKEKLRLELIEKEKQKKEMIEKYIVDNTIDFSKLENVSCYVRETLLMWLTIALESSDFSGKIDDNRKYYVKNPGVEEYCVLKCEDGDFIMPAFKLIFES